MAHLNAIAAMSPRRIQAILTAVIIALLVVANASAHEGPPYPILIDEPVPGYLVSVWADPDVGIGTFYIMTDATATSTAGSTTPAEPRVEVWVQPVSERLPAVTYPAERQQLRNRVQFVSYPKFDQVERWKAGIVITPAGDSSTELVTEVEVTPPGLGAWDLAIYLFPFVLIGGLWFLGLSRRWRERRALQSESAQDLHRVSEKK